MRWRPGAGLTLLETLLAIGILAVVSLAVVAVFVGGLRLLARSSEIATATEIARDFLERTKLTGYGALPPGTNRFDGSVPDPASASGFPQGPYPKFPSGGREYTLVVSSQPVPGSSSLMSVQVEVRWDEVSFVRMETYLSP
ncbi:MAG: hypothetical protein HY319_12515 [Armatimonadetes bacterium]|nr:hypothetical protein [Armatimonadota bacterium]